MVLRKGRKAIKFDDYFIIQRGRLYFTLVNFNGQFRLF